MPQLVVDGEEARGQGVVLRGEDARRQESAHAVRDPQAGLRPGVHGEEGGVLREELEAVREVCAEQRRSEGAGLGVVLQEPGGGL